MNSAEILPQFFKMQMADLKLILWIIEFQMCLTTKVVVQFYTLKFLLLIARKSPFFSKNGLMENFIIWGELK